MARGFNANAANYLQVLDPSGILDTSGTLFTAACWFRPAAGFATTRIFLSKYNGSSGWVFQGISSGKVRVAIAVTGGFDQVDTTTSPAANTWYHIAMVKNGTGAGALRVYLNGVEENNATSNRSVPNTALAFNVGIRSGAVSPFDGRVAEATCWAAALSAAEVLALAKGVSPMMVRPGGTPPYYPLWGVGAADEPDLSPNAQHLTENGTVTVEDHAPVCCPFPVAT